MGFDLFIGIDYSGAKAPESRLRGLQVYGATNGEPRRIAAPFAPPGKHWNWCRAGIVEYLIDLARTDTSFIAGIDHGFSFPISYFKQYGLSSWDDFLVDFVQHWPTHEPGTRVDSIRDRGPARTGEAKEFRLCERWTSSAKSVFQFDVQGQVAKSTHAGIPWLRHIRKEVGDRVHFWPFDGWGIPEGRSVIAEVYPSIFRGRYDKEGQDRTPHEHDAYAVAQWLRETCERGFLERYLDPPLTEEETRIADREGWILGIT